MADHLQMEPLRIPEGITFDDVLLVPQRSDITPDATDTSTRLTRRIRLHIPVLSAPMDTVTEGNLAVALGPRRWPGRHPQESGPRSRKLEKFRGSSGPKTASSPTPSHCVRTIWLRHATERMTEFGVSGFPVTADGTSHGAVAGILTRRDISFVESPDARVGDVMTKDNLVTGAPGMDLQFAEQAMNRGRVEKLLLLHPDGTLAGLITMRDIENVRRHPNACRDERGRLRVGAAVGVLDPERVDALVEAEVDCITVDTAHGHSDNVLQTVRDIKARHDIDVIAGNIATREAAADLIAAGADAVKVGIGPGSICTTRIISGVGVPQLTAIAEACLACSEADIPVIADGGIRQSGDIAKAIGFGAECVMLGSLFAGLEESPGELIIHGGRRFKVYRGMGSIGAMGHGSADRYGQGDIHDHGKFVPEGVEGRVPYRGRLAEFTYQMVGGFGRRWATADAGPSTNCGRVRDSYESAARGWSSPTRMTSRSPRKRRTTRWAVHRNHLSPCSGRFGGWATYTRPRCERTMTMPFDPDVRLRKDSGVFDRPASAAEPAPKAAPETASRDRIVILGRRGAGKTVFLARLYEALWQKREGLLARAVDGLAHQRFMQCVANMEAGHWPEATLAQSWSNLEIRFGAHQWILRVLDYPGEVFRRAFVESAEDDAARMLRGHVDRATAAIVLIDPLAAIQGGVEATVDDEFGLSAALRRVQAGSDASPVPVAVVLTKCDVAIGHIRKIGTPRDFIDHYLPGLVRDGGDFKVFAASAVRVCADALGQPRPAPDKDALGIVEPLQWCLKRLVRDGDGFQ